MKASEGNTLTLLDLRVLVLILGESHHSGWWKSQFLAPVGQSFLERIYPRSTFAAAVRSAGRAALVVHDANIGKGAVFHLFRFPRHLEREIDTALTERSDELSTRFGPLLTDKAALLAQLEACAGETLPSSAVGPVSLAQDSKELAPHMAAVYVQAFREGTQAFPYCETAEGDS